MFFMLFVVAITIGAVLLTSPTVVPAVVNARMGSAIAGSSWVAQLMALFSGAVDEGSSSDTSMHSVGAREEFAGSSVIRAGKEFEVDDPSVISTMLIVATVIIIFIALCRG
ncbi:hypothetical protein R1flu_013614 [Riccia fluitans]|uniref:Uncharacterized protein n=1 Tax=Riccia fluitans TaxID=41844 RepID=A0ABD1YE26_9MARC